jgi:hypothetical protein
MPDPGTPYRTASRLGVRVAEAIRPRLRISPKAKIRSLPMARAIRPLKTTARPIVKATPGQNQT